MRTIFLQIYILVISGTGCITALEAQESREYTKVLNASFGQMTLGASFPYSNRTTDFLRGEDFLGKSYSTPILNYHIGGELSVMVKRILIGSGGFAMFPIRRHAERGAYTYTLSSAYVRVGYDLRLKPHALTYVYVGGGFARNNLIVENSDSVALWPDRDYKLPAGRRGAFWNDCVLYDMGFAFKTACSKTQDQGEIRWGGLLVGAEIGCMLLHSWNGWRYEDYEVPAIPSGKLRALPYLKITFGPGGYIVPGK